MFLRRFKKILKWFFLTLLLLITGIIILINTTWGQNFLISRITTKLSKDLKTSVSISYVGFSLFNKLNAEGVVIEDQQQDTLLFAGKIQVRITDWFFLKDEAELKYIGLEDAVLNTYRNDSVWNYQFFTDYFSSPGGGGNKKGIRFNLKKVSLKNVLFVQQDKWRGKDLSIKMGTMDLDADNIDLSGKTAFINSLSFTGPVVKLNDYPGRRPSSPVTASVDQQEMRQLDSVLQWNDAGWEVRVNRLTIQDGLFKSDKQTDREAFDYFDGKHIAFGNINAAMTGLTWLKDTITANLKLSTKERCGFEVKSMLADVKVTPHIMEFSDMEIKTNNSIIRDYYSMNYDDFNDDMSDYINRIRMRAGFKDAEIDSDDIAYFAPEVIKWDKTIRVNGKARGTVSDLFADDLVVEAGKNTYLNGDISLVGLPNINETFIDFTANRFRTNYAEAVKYIPAIRKIRNPHIDQISYLDFTGSFTGFIRDFVTFGTIRTNLGSVTSDLNMKLPENKAPVYSGTISADGFNLGRFLARENVGNISFDGKVLGHGFQWETLVANLDGEIQHIELNGYNYANIIIDGKMDKKRFEGKGTVDDPNLNLGMNGIIDFNGTVPQFDLVASVNQANLKNLQMTKDDIAVAGRFNLNFSGSNIDNFLGNASITDIDLVKDSLNIGIGSLSILSGYENDKKLLIVESDEFEGKIIGDFTIRDLPDAVTYFLSRYYPAYVAMPKKTPAKQSFSFEFSTRYVDELTPLINPDLSGLNNSVISGKLSLENNELEINADIPFFSYKKFHFNNTRILGNGNFDKLAFDGNISQVYLNDSIGLPNTHFSFTSRNDISDVRISTEKNLSALSGGALNARVQTFSDGVAVHFDTSSFLLNGKTWNIEKDGELSFRSKTISYGQLVLHESDQELKLSTAPSGIGNWNDLNIDLKKINIGDISPYIMKRGRVEGLATGSIRIEDPQNRMNITADIGTDQLRWDNDSIGQINSHVNYNNKTGELTGNAVNTNPYDKIALDMAFFLKDTADVLDDYIDVKPIHYPVKIVERFIGTLFTGLSGYVTGNIKIINPGGDIKIIGKPRLNDAALTVDFTKCRYKIEDTELTFTEDQMSFNGIRIVDRFGRTGTVNGYIKHHSFRDMEYNITARTGVLPMELLNTKEADNSNFYGNARGTGYLTLTGPEQDMKMNIKAVASYADSSFINIPPTDSRETGIADFLVERKYGAELVKTKSSSGQTNITYDVDITSNEMVTVRVILDDLTGDQIQGNGDGNLKIRAGTDEDLTIRGRYNINDGKYLFTFQSFLNKPFDLKKNAGNYIEWTGDPYHATIRIDAVYDNKKKVSFAPIFSNTTLTSVNTNIRDNVYVIAKLRGDLFRPDISFELDFPDGSPAKTDPQLAFTFQQIQNNENELNKQVAYLILSDNFAPYGTAASDISPFGDAVVNTITGKLANEINKALNTFLTKIDPNLRVNFSSSFQRNPLLTEQNTTGSINYDWSSSNITIGRSFFKDRVVFTFEGAVDVPIRGDGTYSTQLFPNLTTEILINKSGTIRATFFYKENVDYFTGTTTAPGNSRAKRFGASMSYRKDFNTLGEFFGKKKKKSEPEPQKTEAKKEEQDSSTGGSQ